MLRVRKFISLHTVNASEVGIYSGYQLSVDQRLELFAVIEMDEKKSLTNLNMLNECNTYRQLLRQELWSWLLLLAAPTFWLARDLCIYTTETICLYAEQLRPLLQLN